MGIVEFKGAQVEAISLDKDDVLVPYHEVLLQWYNKKFGTSIDFGEFEKHGLESMFKMTVEQVQAVLYRFHQSEEFRNMRPYPGAESAIARLAKYRPVICNTARQDHLVEHTNAFNAQYFPDMRGTFFARNKWPAGDAPRPTKVEHCRAQNATSHVDDGISYLQSCHAGGIKVIVFDQSWNRTLQGNGYLRVHNWRELEEVLMLNGRYHAEKGE